MQSQGLKDGRCRHSSEYLCVMPPLVVGRRRARIDNRLVKRHRANKGIYADVLACVIGHGGSQVAVRISNAQDVEAFMYHC
jgi:hypothetical protein